jgi:hypothetical protein|tara:strand:+ start:471 stop:656 length:186 start_codon:yes stop_codon:yes gene_type:complete
VVVVEEDLLQEQVVHMVITDPPGITPTVVVAAVVPVVPVDKPIIVDLVVLAFQIASKPELL